MADPAHPTDWKTPEASELSDVLKAQDAPEAPEVPEVQSAPEAQEAQETPEAPDAPKPQEAPKNPAASFLFPSLSSVLETELTREALTRRPSKLPTGFDALDKELGGGLSPGLIVLGGSPNLGKSTFAIQLAANLARQVSVLYYSMEMTPDRIAAKLVSRELFIRCGEAQDGETPMSADNIISNARLFSAEDWARIDRARRRIQRQTEHLYIIDRLSREDGNTLSFTAQHIADHVHSFIHHQEDELAPPPVVMVDYLQILQSPTNQSRNERQVVEENLNRLVALARDGLIVFLISSLSRGNYDVPLRMDSFKETGGIEYSADVLLGLQFQATRHLKKMEKLDLQAEKRKKPRKVELAVLKQRYGSSENAVPLLYYAQYDCFEPDPDGGSEAAVQEMAAGFAPSVLQNQAPPMPVLAEILLPPAGEAAAEAPAQSPAPASKEPSPVPASSPEVSPAAGPAQAPAEDSAPSGAAASPAPAAASPAPAAASPAPAAASPAPAAASPEAAPEKAPKSIRPFYINNSLIVKQIHQGKCEGVCQPLKDPEITTSFQLSAPLTFFDCAVTDAVYTLRLEHRRAFSPGQVLRILSGDRKQSITGQKERELRASLDKLLETELEIRCAGELQARGLQGRNFQGPVLSLEKQGRLYGFSGETPGPLYAYSQAIKQVIRFPEALLQITPNGQKIPDSRDIICLKRYLIYRLEVARRNQEMKKISFQPDSSLYKVLDIQSRFSTPAAQKQKLQKLQDTAEQILTYYRDIGYLSGFTTIAGNDSGAFKHLKTFKIKGAIHDPWTLFQGDGEEDEEDAGEAE